MLIKNPPFLSFKLFWQFWSKLVYKLNFKNHNLGLTGPKGKLWSRHLSDRFLEATARLAKIKYDLKVSKHKCKKPVIKMSEYDTPLGENICYEHNI